MIDEDKIRARAYEIWQREGRPAGREQEHWDQARRELMGETSRVRGKETVEPAGRVQNEYGEVGHGSVEDALAGNATTATDTPADINDAIPGQGAKPARRTRKRAADPAAGKEAASIPTPTKATKPIRRSSAKQGNEAVETPATEGRVKRAIRKPKGA